MSALLQSRALHRGRQKDLLRPDSPEKTTERRMLRTQGDRLRQDDLL